ncbi:Serine phosphatase RsbU, regulator of sigma subunit [Actinacidiphila guanduensis]|uniref:Serine phosphatase RsbU, regulator of sigma subunit n=1 Tax=Actinacidiphila guanduensis TaxID=310781 RepID=A0A1G9Z6G7_9ACTN|nr:Serine phosphatase RsbU, regulator of sigma subunit [Actinacidiphila guanduensis]
MEEAPLALVTTKGDVRSLNASMAQLLSRPAAECEGRSFISLLPEHQREMGASFLAHVRASGTPSFRVIEFPVPDGSTVASLMEGALVPSGPGESLVRVRAVDSGKDDDGLLIPFRITAKTAGLTLVGRRGDHIVWLGGSAGLAGLVSEPSLSLRSAFQRVHTQDKSALRGLLRGTAASHEWTPLRLRLHDEGWTHLACQIRRLRLGYSGREQTIGIVRDDTQAETRRLALLARRRQEQERADLLQAISFALIRATMEEELRQVVLTRATGTLGADGALLALVRGRSLEVVSDGGDHPELAQAIDGMPVAGPQLLPFVVRTGSPEFITDRAEYVRRGPRRSRLLRLGSGASICLLPLTRGDPRLGALVMTYNERHDWSPDERALVRLVAELVGQALQRIRKQKIRDDLATSFEDSLKPTMPQRLAGIELAARCEPAQDGLSVSGDWYDAFVLKDGVLTLAIGDAQGHDAHAAAFMALVRTSIRAIAAHEHDPGIILAHTNDVLTSMNVESFASCALLRFDRHKAKITGASAGHVPLVRLRNEAPGYLIETLPSGPLLGVLEGASYPDTTFDLGKGDAAVLVTDGVVEGPRLSIDDGIRRVAGIAARAARDGCDAQTIAQRVLGCSAEIGQVDDAAVVVVRHV